MDDIEALKTQYVGYEFDTKTFFVDSEKMVEFARACGERALRYVDPNHTDFQACPTFVSSFMAGRAMPEGFPMFGGIALDGGKDVQPLTPIRPGVSLVGRSHVHDIYAKTGRSGRMIFVVSRMDLYDPQGTQVASADTRLVIKEKQK